MIGITIVLAIGILLGDALMLMVPLWVVALCGVGMLLAAALSARKPLLQSILLLVAVCVTGMWRVGVAHLSDTIVPTKQPSVYEAVVATVPRQNAKTLQCELWLLSTEAPVKVMATFSPTAQQPMLGQFLSFTGSLRPVATIEQKGTFNYRRWLQTQGFQATTYIMPNAWQSSASKPHKLSRWQRTQLTLRQWQAQWGERYRHIGIEEQAAAVVTAMTLGQRTQLSATTRDWFSRSGASHVLALSGLHIGLFYMIIALSFHYLLYYIQLRHDIRCMSAYYVCTQLVALGIVWLYVLLVGMPSSAVRAAIMLTIGGTVYVMQRYHFTMNVVAVTACVLLLIQPFALWDVAYQLSFAAVVAIVGFHRLFRIDRNWQLLSVSVAAQLGTAPLVLYHFGTFPCYFLLTNLIVIPCTLLLLYTSIAWWALSFMPFLQEWVGRFLAFIAHFLLASVSGIASLPGATLEGISLSPLQVVAIYVLIVCSIQIIWLILQRR